MPDSSKSSPTFGCSEATRLLCYAAYEDDRLCEKIIDNIVHNKHRAIAPCYGVDLIEVLINSYEAKRQKLRRDILISLCSIIVIIGLVVPSSGLLILGLLMAWGILTYNEISIRTKILSPRLSRQNFKIEAQNQFRIQLPTELLQYIMESQNGNVIFYGGFSPFVGAGIDMGGWSFVVDTKKGKNDLGTTLEPEPFEIDDIYDHMNVTFSSLDQERVLVQDKLFVNGRDIQSDQRFLSNPFSRPVTHVHPNMIRAFISHPSQTIRVYKCLRLTDWKGELILSIFLRFFKVDNYLFIEESKFLLTPIDNKYRGIDSFSTSLSFRDIFVTALKDVFFSLIYVFFASPVMVIKRILEPYSKRRAEKKTREEIRKNPCFNYGAETSPREQTASPVYINYFQKLDKEMYVKIIERTILDGIVKFLDERNIDTSEFKEREATILNAGVIVSGGSIQAESLAVGEGAQATTAQFTSRMRNIGAHVVAGTQGKAQK